jgi:hypothetical protein
MAVIGKLTRLVGKRLLKKSARKTVKKVMSSRQKQALMKAVKASALKRKKSVIKVVKYAPKKPMSRLKVRSIVRKYAKPSNFENMVVNKRTITAKAQSKVFGKVMKKSLTDHNNILKAQNRAFKAAQGGGLDWKRSLLYSAGITAALNPTYTKEKFNEAKQAIARKIT